MDEKLNKDNLHGKKTFLSLVANDQVKRVFKVPKEITQRISFFLPRRNLDFGLFYKLFAGPRCNF